MTDKADAKIIDPRRIRPLWYVLATVVSIAALIMFYVLQTTGYSDNSKGFSIDMSEPSGQTTQG